MVLVYPGKGCLLHGYRIKNDFVCLGFSSTIGPLSLSKERFEVMIQVNFYILSGWASLNTELYSD